MSPCPVAIITGGARRIGAATCRYLHNKGFNIVIHYNTSSDCANALYHELNQTRPNSATIYQANLNDLSQITKLVKFSEQAWGRVDALINNASSFYPTAVADANEEQWNDLLSSNLKAPFFLAQKLHPALATSNGCIVNIADIFADRPMPKHCIYSVAKAGNKMLTQSLALEFAPNIRVNSVAPGAILWPEDENGNEIEHKEKLKLIPLGKLGGTDAITQAIYFLIQYSPYTTGQVLRVDGGRSLT